MSGRVWINRTMLLYNQTLDYIGANFLYKGALFMDLWKYKLQAAIFLLL